MPLQSRPPDRPWLPVVVSTQIIALTFMLFCGLTPRGASAGEEPAASERVPTAPLPPPPPAEQLLAPIPSPFDWMQRDVHPNPLLESLLQLTERPPQLLMSISLTEEYSDNFFHTEDNAEEEFRTGLDLGTIYRLEGGGSFLSLANSLGLAYDVRADRISLPFINLALNAGYQLPRLSLSLSESFIRSDDIQDSSPTGLRGERRTFFRNSVIPQLRYDLSRTTALSFSYNNTIVQEQERRGGTTSGTTEEPDNSFSHAVSANVLHWFRRNLSGSAGYTYATIDSDQSGNRQAHSGVGDLSYLLDRRTTTTFQTFTTITNRSEGEPDSRFYGFTLGLQRQLTSYLSIYVAAGPALLDREGQAKRLFPNWQAAINGGIPLTRRTTLRISTSQGITNTAGDIDDVGLVLSQTAEATLSHALSRDLIASLFGSYSRSELLESSSTGTSNQGEKFSYWNAGGRMTYALTPVLSLNVTYRYQQRDADETSGGQTDERLGESYRENRVMVTLSAAFRLL